MSAQAFHTHHSLQLILGPNAAWFSTGHAPVDLRSRPKHQRILWALVKLHGENPDGFLTVNDLVALAWPGERLRRPSARNRLHVTLNYLRRVGLYDIIERLELGYRLVPSITIAISDHIPDSLAPRPSGVRVIAGEDDPNTGTTGA